MKDKGLDIVSVNGVDDANTIQAYWRAEQFSIPVVMKGDSVFEKYQVEATPTNVVVDHDGSVVAYIEGFDEEALRAALTKVGIQ